MLYQDADDKILEQDIYIDLNEAERVGSTDNVQIVAQIDRYRGGYQGDGDWTAPALLRHPGRRPAARALEERDGPGRSQYGRRRDPGRFRHLGDGELPGRQVRADPLGPRHGLARRLERPDQPRQRHRALPLASATGDQLYLNELDAGPGEIRSQTGVDKFELIGMDACLMGQLEVLTALAPHARYAVASQETEPALGWAYARFLGD